MIELILKALLIDATTFIVTGLIITWVYFSRTTAAATGAIMMSLAIFVQFSTQPVRWLDWWIFPGQLTMPLACVILAAVHFRMGCLAAHRVWRQCSIGLVLLFMFATRYAIAPGADDVASIAHLYNDQVLTNIRTYVAAMFLFIIAGGVGQVIWKWLDDKPATWRYATIFLAVVPSSMLHSYIGFYQKFNVSDAVYHEAFWASAWASLFLSVPIIGLLLILVWLHGDDNKVKQAQLIRASARSITPHGVHHGGSSRKGKSN